MEDDPDSLDVLKSSFAATAEAAETAQGDLAQLEVPPAVEPLRATMVEQVAAFRDAALAVSEAGSFQEVDQVFPAFEEAAAAVGESGKVIRTALGLPAADPDC